MDLSSNERLPLLFSQGDISVFPKKESSTRLGCRIRLKNIGWNFDVLGKIMFFDVAKGK